MTDEHRTARLIAQMVEASNDVIAAINRLEKPEQTPASLLDYCGRAVASSRALCRLADATLAVTQQTLLDVAAVAGDG